MPSLNASQTRQSNGSTDAHMYPLEYTGTHANENLVLDDAAMQLSSMPDCDIVADLGAHGMPSQRCGHCANDNTILQVGVVANDDGTVIACIIQGMDEYVCTIQQQIC